MVVFGQTQSTTLLILYFPFPACRKIMKHQQTLKQTKVYRCFQRQQKYDKTFGVKTVYFFHTFINCGKT